MTTAAGDPFLKASLSNYLESHDEAALIPGQTLFEAATSFGGEKIFIIGLADANLRSLPFFVLLTLPYPRGWGECTDAATYVRHRRPDMSGWVASAGRAGRSRRRGRCRYCT